MRRMMPSRAMLGHVQEGHSTTGSTRRSSYASRSFVPCCTHGAMDVVHVPFFAAHAVRRGGGGCLPAWPVHPIRRQHGVPWHDGVPRQHLDP